MVYTLNGRLYQSFETKSQEEKKKNNNNNKERNRNPKFKTTNLHTEKTVLTAFAWLTTKVSIA